MKVGLALGSGSARGFSHIGIIDCLLDQGIVPDVVAGTSIGAIVGACYVSGHLERLRKQALAIDRKSTRLNSSHKTESRMPSSA